MRFGKYLSTLTKPELEKLKENCNFSEEEEVIFLKLAKNKSITEISMNTGFSTSTINRRICDIRQKVVKINGSHY